MPEPRRRTTVKQDRIVRALRRDIVAGTIAPGAQLPNQFELVKRFQVSTVTIQRALERLAKDGFIVSHPRQGVFVRNHPPHLSDYCLIFPFDPVRMAQTQRFLFSLSQIAAALSSQGNQRTAIFYGMEHPLDSADYHALVDMIEGHRTAGLIFLSRPGPFIGTPLLQEDGIPRVAIMGEPTIPGITAIRLDSYAEPALDWLAAQRCRRLAMICAPQLPESLLNYWATHARARQMALPRHNILGVSADFPHWARAAVETLMDRPADTRPDGLIILDDNLVPQATAGLLAAGVRVPEDCRVVAHGNFPWTTESLVPAQRFGPDTRQVLQACLDAIDVARRGEKLPPVITVPAVSQE